MDHKLNVEEKSKPGIIFNLFIPISFQISAPISLQKKFKQFNYLDGQKKNKSSLLREQFFEFFGVSNETELLKKNKHIRKKVNEVKNEVMDEMGLDSREFSNVGREWVEKILKNQEVAGGKWEKQKE